MTTNFDQTIAAPSKRASKGYVVQSTMGGTYWGGDARGWVDRLLALEMTKAEAESTAKNLNKLFSSHKVQGGARVVRANDATVEAGADTFPCPAWPDPTGAARPS